MRNIITIFGSTGDLTIRKLLPAIKRLLEEKLLEKDTLVLAIGRRDYQTVEYLDFVKKKLTP